MLTPALSSGGRNDGGPESSGFHRFFDSKQAFGQTDQPIATQKNNFWLIKKDLQPKVTKNNGFWLQKELLQFFPTSQELAERVEALT